MPEAGRSGLDAGTMVEAQQALCSSRLAEFAAGVDAARVEISWFWMGAVHSAGII